MAKLIIDYDPIIYLAGSIGETRTVKITHKQSGDEYEFPTRTDFYGRGRAKNAGWLADYNKVIGEQDLPPRLAEDFIYEDVQEPEPLSNCLHTTKSIIKRYCQHLGISKYYGYSGKGVTFREAKSTILKYKGNREGLLKPVHLEDIKLYLQKHHACEIVEEIEADDAISIDCYEAWHRHKKTGNDNDKLVLAAVDKDYYGIACNLFNTNDFDNVCSYDGFGWLEEKEITSGRKIVGRGRLFLYFQVLSGDSSDNYKANSASDKKWGDLAAYKALKDCKTDKEAFTALVRCYKELYPSEKEFTGWRGDTIKIDWLYMLQENFTLAHMLRWLGDSINVIDTLIKLKIDTEGQ